jgi:antitoxin HigA-1
LPYQQRCSIAGAANLDDYREGEKTVPMHNPPHPGEVIKTEIVEAHGLTATAAAAALRVTRPALSALLNCRIALSAEMALRIEKAFGPRMETLMGMQNSYDVFRARQREKEINVRPYRRAKGAKVR